VRRTSIGIASMVLLATSIGAVGQEPSAPKRPKIYGIAGVRFTIRNAKTSNAFYSKILESDKPCVWCGDQVGLGYSIFYAYNDQHVLLDQVIPILPDIEQAAYRLRKNGIELTEEPKIGRDGKRQLNLYDPDMTRVELMEFTPTEKPCCSEYTGPHPKP
jgi:hypothetical protein